MNGHGNSKSNGNEAAWAMPSFARNFEACRHQQVNKFMIKSITSNYQVWYLKEYTYI